MKRVLYGVVVAEVLFGCHGVIAAPITYDFGGTVTQLGMTPPGVNIGEQIPISITVNDPGTGGPSYSYTQGSPGTPLIPTALFDGINYTSLFQSITIQVGSSISFQTTVPMTNYGFSLTLTGAKNGALASGALPTSLDPGDFAGGTFTVINVFENGNRYSGTINMTPAPEPASWLLLGAGFLGTVWQIARRRRSVRASESGIVSGCLTRNEVPRPLSTCSSG